MANKLLYIFDETASLNKAVSYCVKEGQEHILLCPITTSEKSISSAVASFTSAGIEVERLPYLDCFHKTAFSQRDNFIDFIHDFGVRPRFKGENLREYFKCAGTAFSAWWLSLIAEKNTFKTDSYNNLIKFLVIMELAKQNGCGRILADIRSGELSRALVGNRRFGRYECRDLRGHGDKHVIGCFLKNFAKGMQNYMHLVYKFFIVKINIKRAPRPGMFSQKDGYVAVTYFPFVDKEALGRRKFVNRYYGPMQSALEDRHGDKFMWLALTLDMDGYDFKKSVRLAGEIRRWGYPLFLIEEWLTFSDLLVIISRHLYFTLRFLIKAPYLAKEFKYNKYAVNLWQIFKNDWFSSFSGDVLMNGLTYHRLFEKISRVLREETAVIYLAENQAWEKAMNAVFHNIKGVKTTGIIHTTAPLLFLPYFDFKESTAGASNDGLSMPEPDRLACNGNITYKLMLDAGWSASRVFIHFALRYQHLKERLKEDIPWASRQNMILVSLTSTTPHQVREMLLYIYEAFEGRKDYHVIIKEHYAYPLKSLLKRLNLKLDEEVFSFSNKKIDELLRSAKAMIVSDSSVSLDSIAFGCPVIIPRLSSVIDTNPLSGISDIPIYVNSPGELRSAVDGILAAKESPIESRRREDLIRDYFEMTGDADDLMAKFENRLTNRKNKDDRGVPCPKLA